tara:strand:+ start:1423 stop:1806 length:384 start_codon:yes stop_codon:yes gene_type:complete
MSLNNTPFKFNNQTKFVPAKPPEFTNTMTTYERLDAAEKELRAALSSVTGNASATNLRKLLNLIEDVEKVKRAYVGSNELQFNAPDPDMYSGYIGDNINFNLDSAATYAAGEVPMPGAAGQDVITFS